MGATEAVSELYINFRGVMFQAILFLSEFFSLCPVSTVFIRQNLTSVDVRF